MTIARLLTRSAQLWGDKPALIDAVRDRTMSFAELAGAAFFVGHTLRQRGLAPGDRVALLGDATPDYLAADYGVMSAGLVRVPLDPSLSADELAAQIADAGARVLLTDNAQIQFKNVECLPLSMGAFEQTAHPEMDDLGPGALASLNYTGGTSGEPKAVMLAHANLRAIVQNVVMARGMGPGDAMINMRPLWPIAGIIVLAHLAAGGSVVLGGRFEPSHMVELLQKYRAACTSMVPTHLVRMLRDIPAATLHALDALRAIDMGAASIAPETFEQAYDAFGPKIGVLYGLTEASWSCYQPPSWLDAPPDIRRARMKTVGRPLFGVDLMIASESGAAPANEPGEILIRGAHIMQGYWKRPDLTAQALKGDWFSTGDLGAIDDSGIVSILGRIKEVIRSGGKSVQPNEVEAALRRHPGVEDVSVVGIPDVEWGELVTAAVVAAPGATVSERTLKEHCAALLSSHKRPKLIQIVSELPKSHYGKVQHGKVRELIERHRKTGV